MAKEKQTAEEELEEDQFDSGSTEVLRTHELINSRYSGDLDEIKDGFARVSLITNEDMRVDSQGLVHGGFIFCAADHAAMAAVNDPNVVLASSSSTFLSPARVGDQIIFEAKVRHKDGRKREVIVVGHILDIKIYEGSFKAVVLEKHVLKLNLMHASKSD